MGADGGKMNDETLSRTQGGEKDLTGAGQTTALAFVIYCCVMHRCHFTS